MTKKHKSTAVFAGVDVGSLATKSVVLVDGKIAGQSMVPTGPNSERNGLIALENALENAGLTRDELTFTVATGYGRISATYANKTVTEITCHAKGAYHLHPTTKTIIDIGGQDCKAIKLDADGNVSDFAMNDKCAAGTGRFLEVISTVLKVKLEDLGPLSLQATKVVPISSTCAVFAESETVSLLARGETTENIVKGIHYAIANRIAGMSARIGVETDVLFSGGVAKNAGMRAALAEVLKVKINVPEFDPQLVGALGAALIAQNQGAGAALPQV
jgi:(R)-2-hydroxyacyl-CoA dehydratese activating ATPase